MLLKITFFLNLVFVSVLKYIKLCIQKYSIYAKIVRCLDFLMIVVILIFLLTHSEVVAIYNGKMANKGQFPFAVSFGLVTENSSFVHICGGSNIKNDLNHSWALSASHCFMNFEEREMYAVIGKTVLSNNEGVRCIVQRVFLNEFTVFSYQNDIALVAVKCPHHNNLKTIELSSTGSSYNYDCLIYGYGNLNFNNDDNAVFSNGLFYGNVIIISQEECEQLIGRSVAPIPDNGQFCARGMVDACPGDSGGAMICKNLLQSNYKLVGVISYGTPCGQSSVGIYQDIVSYFYWIDFILKNGQKPV